MSTPARPRAARGLQLVGPLYVYDLARLARRGRTTLLRCTYAALLLVWLCVLVSDRFPGLLHTVFLDQSPALSISEWAAFARSYVLVLLAVQAAAVMVLTPVYLAGAFAEEKERRTLALLFTTDLRDRELVLGKLLGRLLHLATILLAALPIFAVTRLWGGINDDVLLAGFAVSALTMLSVGSLSLLCSVLSRTVLAAVVSSYAFVVLLNLCCLAVPVTSPLLFVAEWDRQVEADWKEWQEQWAAVQPISGSSQSATGLLALFPPPHPTWILLQMLVPYGLFHGSIFLVCAVTAIKVLRASCLAPGEILLRGVLPQGTAIFAWGSPAWLATEAKWPPLTAAYRPKPVCEPALLWKEMDHGTSAMPGPSLHDWFLTSWRQILVLLGSLFEVSLLGWWMMPARWSSAIAVLNVFFRLVSVLLAGTWCLLLAFRVAGCISREREQQTLEGLLTLPVDREEILCAKWLGSILRFRQFGYGLVVAWALGVAIGALHPLAVLLLVTACTVHLACLASLGLWLSLVSRKTLWANISMALVLFFWFSGSWLGWTFGLSSSVATEGGWLRSLLEVQIAPGQTWWFAAFSWRDLTEGIASDDRRFVRAFLEALAGLLFFGVAAWVFWRLSCRRFVKDTPRPIASLVPPSCPENNGTTKTRCDPAKRLPL